MDARRRWLAGPGTAAGWVSVGALALLLAGCESFGSSRRATAPPAMQHQLLADIPLPGGFKLDDDRSVGRVVGKTRLARCVFEGNTDRAAVNRFFKEYMPSGGWELLEERFDRGVYYMRYQSPQESCSLTIGRETFKTVITVDVGPLATASVPQEVQPAGHAEPKDGKRKRPPAADIP